MIKQMFNETVNIGEMRCDFAKVILIIVDTLTCFGGIFSYRISYYKHNCIMEFLSSYVMESFSRSRLEFIYVVK